MPTDHQPEGGPESISTDGPKFIVIASDAHFGHAGARGLYRRPFASVKEMDAAMVDRWNACVAPADDIWHLGDFAVGPAPARVADLLQQLNGRKHLVAGNNDVSTTTALSGWASVQPYAEIEVDGASLVLCHYAFRTWRNIGRGWWNLHGHSHGRLKPMTRQCDVGVDAWYSRPVTFEQVASGRRRGRTTTL